MEKYVVALALCTISGILAGLVHKFIVKDKKIEIKYIYFYSVVFYGVMSLIKLIKGEGKRTLFSSFIEVSSSTYIHYGIPLIILAVVIPVLIKILLREEKRELFIGLYSSVFSFIVGIEFLICGVIANSNYIVISIISILISLGTCAFYKGNVGFYCAQKRKERVLFILPVILLWTVTVMIFEPNQLILNSLSETSIPYFRFLWMTFVVGIAFAVAYFLVCVFILSDRQLKLFGIVIFGISVAGYIQGNFLNGEMLLMDGTVQTWSIIQKLINGVIWLVVVAAAFYAGYSVRHSSICKKIIVAVCLYLCLVQTLTLTFMIITAKFPDEENKFMLTTNNMLELDDENNVVVFVLDWFDQQIMEDILDDDKDFVNKLGDFTNYTNTTSCYAYTSLSIPYMLTGVEWEYGMEADEYCEYAFENSNFLKDIKNHNYSIGIYTGGEYIGNNVKGMLLNYSNEISQKLGYKKLFYVINDTSKYKMAPFAAKKFYFYTTDDIEDIVVNSGEYSIKNDIIFHNELKSNKLSVDKSGDYEGAFRFYHMKGAHALFTMNENFEEVKEDGTRISQSKGALKIVYEYIDEMKRLGIYENSTIIVTADHGQNQNVMKKSAVAGDYEMVSTPILFVKLPGEKHENGPVKSSAPVSHREFPATIIKAVGGNPQSYGKVFSQIGVDEDRSREFTFVVPPDKRYAKYIIRGNANDVGAWSVIDG